MERNLVPLNEILVPSNEGGRIREQKSIDSAVERRVISLLRFGQLQPVLVEALPEEVDGKKWKLVDGHVRWLSLGKLAIRHMLNEADVVASFASLNMTPGMIEITTREKLEPEMALMMEFHANEDRDGFSWEERGRYIRRIHELLIEKFGEKGRSQTADGWSAKKTAEYINQSEASVSQYLQLTDPKNVAAKSEKVVTAKTKNTALKQLKIEENRVRHKKETVAIPTKAIERLKTNEPEAFDATRTASLSIYHGDCRDWIKRIPDNSLDWFHWDPPYGGKEGAGGAFSTHAGIQEDVSYMTSLTLDMLPEIWRVLKDGHWMAIWYTPVHYHWLRLALQGHRFNLETSICEFCNKHILRDYDWLSDNYSCRSSPFRFWVNPFPNQWRKTNRVADGHEITRFLTKETEPFLLAGKQHERSPILLRSDRGNVFEFPGFAPHDAERRHVHHKPPRLLEEILGLVSVPGSLGGDAGGGSGSIIEASYRTGRRILVAEMSDEYHPICLGVGTKELRDRKVEPNMIAPWLEKNFAE